MLPRRYLLKRYSACIESERHLLGLIGKITGIQ